MSLLLWYPFTQDGYNRGAIEGNHLSPTLNNTGILGKCGFANKVTLGTNLDLGGDYSPLNTSSTMTAWVKMNFDECKTVIANTSVNSSAHTPTSCVVGSTSYGGLGICWQSNNIYNDGNRAELSSIRLFGYTRGTNSAGAVQVTTTAKNITFGKWHHVALVTNQVTKKIAFYFDGSLVSENSYSSMTAITTGRPFGLNRNQVYGGNGPGALLPIYYNDVRFYDEELSVKEIRELAKGLAVHYTFNDPYIESTTNLIYDKYQGFQSSLTKLTETFNGMEIYKNVVTNPYTGTARDNAGFCHKAAIPHTQEQAKQPYFQLSFWKRLNQSYGVNIGGYIYVTYTDGTTGTHYWSYSKSNWGTDINSIGKWEYITARATLSSGKTVKEITRFYVYGRSATGGDCDFAGIQLEAKDHTTPYVEGSRISILFNEAGYDEPISFQNLELTSDTISGSYAGKFDSSKPTQIRTSLDLGGSTDVTIACWLYPQSGTTAFTDNALYCVMSGTSLSLYAYGRSNDWLDCGSCLTLNAWNHVVVTYSATERVVYVNGIEIKRGAISGTFDTRNSLDIGYGSTTTRAFNGKIADFRIYKTPLNAEDVLELYEGKAAVDKSHNVFTNEIIEQNEVANMVNLGSWEQGGIQDANGTDANNMNNRARTKYIPVLPNTPYYFQAASGWDIRGVHFYKKDNTWISYTTIGSSGVRTTPADCYYMRFIVQNDSSSLDALIADIATFGPVMVPGNTATTSGMAAATDAQVTKFYQIKTKDICENHDAGFFKDGTASGNRFYEI